MKEETTRSILPGPQRTPFYCSMDLNTTSTAYSYIQMAMGPIISAGNQRRH
ncbi:rCG31438 [Rattus norvegicus]|uniref:RCG31438 n=1 Tax=Rattus norvegicus TaxID=10116 RepID=A6IU67_RAT|nr:rCG31438 [Rattus norvegicus]